MKNLGDERGQTLVFVAIAMSVLLGFAAFATDIGIMLHAQRLAQTAADSAAIAGATSLHYGDSAAAAAARNDAAANGFTDGKNGVTVSVSTPPSSSEVGNPVFAASGFIKVTVTKTVPGYFMRVFNHNSMNISASAVATNRANGDTCIYVLNQSAPDAMELQGSFNVAAPNCGIIVDSSSGDALNFGGSSGTLKAGAVSVVGGASGQTGDSTPTPTLNAAPASDPLAWEPTPSYNLSNCTGTGTTYTLTGNVVGSASNSVVCYGGNVTLKNAYLAPGTYVFTGNVTLSGFIYGPSDGSTSGTVNTTLDTANGQGVTLYIASGSISTTTNSNINLTAPVSESTVQPPYNGLLIYQPLTNSNTMTFQTGNSIGTITGIIYAPGAQLFLNDSGGDSKGGTTGTGGTTSNDSITFNVDLDVNTFYDKTASLSLTSYSKTAGSGSSPLTKVTLVE